MRYFSRTNRLANILLALSGICFMAMFITFFKGQELRFFFFLASTLFSLVIGIALKGIVKDAKEDLGIINNTIHGSGKPL